MLKEFVSGRVCVFIDAANILYSQRSLGWRVDYEKLRQYFEEQSNLAGLYLYTSYIKEDWKQNAFLIKLGYLGYQVISKEVKQIDLGNGLEERKGNLDAELIVGVFEHINEFDTLVLLSGDSDFASLLDALKRQGKRVIVMSTKNHVSIELLKRAKYLDLKKLEEDIAL